MNKPSESRDLAAVYARLAEAQAELARAYADLTSAYVRIAELESKQTRRQW